jgi:hypothetical protein
MDAAMLHKREALVTSRLRGKTGSDFIKNAAETFG